MIQIDQIRNYFPTQIRGNSVFDKYILKEYLQLMILDYLSSTPSIQKISFIGGTSLRLVKAAMLARAKGRDFYDLMFLLALAKPDYDFLAKRCGVHNLQMFKQATAKLLETVDLKSKQRDFEHLLFKKANSEMILRFGEFVNSLTE